MLRQPVVYQGLIDGFTLPPAAAGQDERPAFDTGGAQPGVRLDDPGDILLGFMLPHEEDEAPWKLVALADVLKGPLVSTWPELVIDAEADCPRFGLCAGKERDEVLASCLGRHNDARGFANRQRELHAIVQCVRSLAVLRIFQGNDIVDRNDDGLTRQQGRNVAWGVQQIRLSPSRTPWQNTLFP